MKKWITTGLSGFFALIALLSGRFFACLIALVIGALFLPIPAWQEKVDKYVAKKLKKYVAIGLAFVFLIALPATESTTESDVNRNMPEVVTEEVVTTEQQEAIVLPVVEEASEESSADTESESNIGTTTAPTTAPTTEATTVATTAPTTEATVAPTTEATTVATTAPTTQATTTPTTQATTAPTQATTAPTAEATTAPPVAEKCNYVINTNTKKFHKPGCSSVKDIKAENRWDYFGTKDEVLAMGYESCKKCHP